MPQRPTKNPDASRGFSFLLSGQTRFLIATLALAAAAFAVYAPGLSGSFFFDDYPHIVDNPLVSLGDLSAADIKRAVLSSSAGPLKRPISMLSFGVNHHFAGLDPFWYKLTNIAIHVASGLLLGILASFLLRCYRLCFRPEKPLPNERWIALAAAALWLLHPLNLTSVLYVVQRMTSLSSFFVICGMIAFVQARLRLLEGQAGLGRLFALTLISATLAVLSKETGVLIFLYLLAIELSLFRFRARNVWARRGVITFFSLFVFLPAIAFLVLTVREPAWITAAYVERAFTLQERVLTETRVLWEYLRFIVLPDITQMALHHDDFPLSRGLLAPATTLAATVGHLALVVLAWKVRRAAPLIALAVVWFYLGHALESTVFALEIMHEHRNYLPMFGILLAFSYYVFGHDVLPRHGRLKTTLGLAFVTMCGLTTTVRSAQYGDFWGFPVAEATKHPASARANYEAGRALVMLMDTDSQNRAPYAPDAERFLRQAMAADPNELAAPLALIRLYGMNGRNSPPDLIEEFERRLGAAPPPNAIAELFRSFYLQVEAGKLGLQESQIQRIYAAALGNTKLQGEKRAHVLTSSALVHLNVLSDAEGAVQLLRQATEASPSNPEFRVVLAASLQSVGRSIEAITTLDEAERLDPRGYMRRDIASIRRAASGSDSR